MKINPSSPEQLKAYEKFLSPALLTNTKYQKSAKGHVSGTHKDTGKVKERMEKGVGQIFSNLGLKVQAGFARLQHLIFTRKSGDPLWMNNAAVLQILNKELQAINDLDTAQPHSDDLKTNVKNALEKLEIIDQLNRKYIKGHTKKEDRLKKLEPQTASDGKTLPAKTIRVLKEELTQVKAGLEAPKSAKPSVDEQSSTSHSEEPAVVEQPAVHSEEPRVVEEPVVSHSDVDVSLVTPKNSFSEKVEDKPVKPETGSRLSNVGSALASTAQGVNKAVGSAVDKTKSGAAAAAKKTKDAAHFAYSKAPTKKALFFGALGALVVALGMGAKELASKVEIEKIDLDALMKHAPDLSILSKPQHKTPPEPVLAGFSGDFTIPETNEKGTAQVYPFRFVTLADLEYAKIAAQKYLAATLLPNTQGVSDDFPTDTSIKAVHNQNGNLTFSFSSLSDTALVIFREVQEYVLDKRNAESGISNTDVKGQDVSSSAQSALEATQPEPSISFDNGVCAITIPSNMTKDVLKHLGKAAEQDSRVANALVEAASSEGRLIASRDDAVALRNTSLKHNSSKSVIPKAFANISFGICDAPTWSNESKPLSDQKPKVKVEVGDNTTEICLASEESFVNDKEIRKTVIQDLSNLEGAQVVHDKAGKGSVNITVPTEAQGKAVKTPTTHQDVLNILSDFPAEKNICILGREVVKEAVRTLQKDAAKASDNNSSTSPTPQIRTARHILPKSYKWGNSLVPLNTSSYEIHSAPSPSGSQGSRDLEKTSQPKVAVKTENGQVSIKFGPEELFTKPNEQENAILNLTQCEGAKIKKDSEGVVTINIPEASKDEINLILNGIFKSNENVCVAQYKSVDESAQEAEKSPPGQIGDKSTTASRESDRVRIERAKAESRKIADMLNQNKNKLESYLAKNDNDATVFNEFFSGKEPVEQFINLLSNIISEAMSMPLVPTMVQTDYSITVENTQFVLNVPAVLINKLEGMLPNQQIKKLSNVKDNKKDIRIEISEPLIQLMKFTDLALSENVPGYENFEKIFNNVKEAAVQEGENVLKTVSEASMNQLVLGALGLVLGGIVYDAFKSGKSSSKKLDPQTEASKSETMKTETKGGKPKERVLLTAAMLFDAKDLKKIKDAPLADLERIINSVNNASTRSTFKTANHNLKEWYNKFHNKISLSASFKDLEVKFKKNTPELLKVEVPAAEQAVEVSAEDPIPELDEPASATPTTPKTSKVSDGKEEQKPSEGSSVAKNQQPPPVSESGHGKKNKGKGKR